MAETWRDIMARIQQESQERRQLVLEQKRAGRSYEEIARSIGVTRERVRQLHNSALRDKYREMSQISRSDRLPVHPVDTMGEEDAIARILNRLVASIEEATLNRDASLEFYLNAKYRCLHIADRAIRAIMGWPIGATDDGNADKRDRDVGHAWVDSIERLDLSPRTYNCLMRANMHLIGEVAMLSDKELREVRGLGAKGIAEIHAAVARLSGNQDSQ